MFQTLNSHIYLFIMLIVMSCGVKCILQRESHEEIIQQAGEVPSRLQMTPSKGGPADVHDGRATVQRDGQGEEGANRVSQSNVREVFNMIPRTRLRHKRGQMLYTPKSFYYQK